MDTHIHIKFKKEKESPSQDVGKHMAPIGRVIEKKNLEDIGLNILILLIYLIILIYLMLS